MAVKGILGMKVIAEMCGFRKIVDIPAPKTRPPEYIRVRTFPRLDRVPDGRRPDPEKIVAHDLQLRFVGFEDMVPVYTITLEEVLEQCRRQ